MQQGQGQWGRVSGERAYSHLCMVGQRVERRQVTAADRVGQGGAAGQAVGVTEREEAGG